MSWALSFVIPIMLFGIDLITLQSVSAGLEAYATTISLKASTSGLNDRHYLEAEEGRLPISLSSWL